MSKKTQTRVLLIEDSGTDAILIKSAIGQHRSEFSVKWVRTLAEGLSILQTSEFDVILSDMGLPDASGLPVIQSLRKQADHLPIVVLTGLDCDTVAMSALDEGAQDYLTKDNMTADGLSRAIRYAIQRQQNSVMRNLVSQLTTSQKLLEQQNQSLSQLYRMAHQFVDNVSHEFRTPLAVIKEYVALMGEGLAGEINSQQKQMLQTVEDRADDLNTMVDDMLDVSKLEAGVLSVCRKKANVKDVIDHVYSNLEKKANRKGVTLRIDIAPDLPTVFCDAEKIGRVLINLAVNAIKFCGRPGQVTVSAETHDDRSEIEIRVTDNGPGIGQEELQVIFNRFKQLDSSVARSTKGFGLGLSIAKELVTLNYGQINVESQLGKGSTFSFTIPYNEPLHVINQHLVHLENRSTNASHVSLFTVELCDDKSFQFGNEIDNLFEFIIRENELMFRLDAASWLIVSPGHDSETEDFIERVQNSRKEINRNRPLGPLPEIEIVCEGSWCIENDRESFLENATRLLGSICQTAQSTETTLIGNNSSTSGCVPASENHLSMHAVNHSTNA